MIKNYLLITLRSMMKSKVYIFINILGMAISIASCIVAYFNYDYNAQFDNNHLNADKIYRINSIREFQNQRRKFGHVPLAMGNAVRSIPDLDHVTRFYPGGGNFRVKEELFNSNVSFVDSAFFKMFTFDFIEGDGNVGDPTKVYISDELATKYFGKEKALGRTITQVLDSGRLKEFEVAGVFKKQPRNSSFTNDMFMDFRNQFNGSNKDYHEDSWYYRTTVFVQFADPSRVPVVQNQIQTYTENNNKIREDFFIREYQLQSLQGMAIIDTYDNVPGTWTNGGSPIAAVAGIAVMAILVLLIACFNLTNTTIAISSRRLKEIGIRKVMGSMRKHLIFQFLGETVLVCFASLVIGMFIAEYLLIPTFNAMWPQLKVDANYVGNPGFVFFSIIVLLFTAVLAGAYPAFYISKFQPTSILKGKLKFGGTSYLTLGLQTLQFAISLAGIVCAFAFTENAKYQRDFDLGFNKAGVVFTYVDNRSEYETYRNALLENPDIISIAGSEHHLFSGSYNDPLKHEDKQIEADILNVGDDYVATVGLTILEGRDFRKDSDTDRKESVIVTEGLARAFGWDKPIGKEIIWMDTVKLYVVGVVKDIYNNGMWDAKDPIMLRYGKKDPISHVLVSAPADKLVDVNKFMEAKWQELFPNRLYYSRYLDEEMVDANTVNTNIVKMFVFLGIVALMLSATGLFTLVSLNIIRRMKEIGVRKVLGASMGNITRVVNKQFAFVLLIACVGGGLLGAWLSAMLMESIWDYYLRATPVAILISACILIGVSIISVGYKIYSTLRVNPSTVLRDE